MKKTTPESIEASAQECAKAALAGRLPHVRITVEASELPHDAKKFGYKSAIALYIGGTIKRIWAFTDKDSAATCAKRANAIYKKSLKEGGQHETKTKTAPPDSPRVKKSEVKDGAKKAGTKAESKGTLSPVEALRLRLAERRQRGEGQSSKDVKRAKGRR